MRESGPVFVVLEPAPVEDPPPPPFPLVPPRSLHPDCTLRMASLSSFLLHPCSIHAVDSLMMLPEAQWQAKSASLAQPSDSMPLRKHDKAQLGS